MRMNSTILDSHLVIKKTCEHKQCPTDEDLKKYPMLDEDLFEEIDERLYHCEICKKRLADERKASAG